ncbi:MAG: hypothetical protein ACU0B1_03575 [Thermohalobaculum sp.]
MSENYSNGGRSDDKIVSEILKSYLSFSAPPAAIFIVLDLTKQPNILREFDIVFDQVLFVGLMALSIAGASFVSLFFSSIEALRQGLSANATYNQHLDLSEENFFDVSRKFMTCFLLSLIGFILMIGLDATNTEEIRKAARFEVEELFGDHSWGNELLQSLSGSSLLGGIALILFNAFRSYKCGIKEIETARKILKDAKNLGTP